MSGVFGLRVIRFRLQTLLLLLLSVGVALGWYRYAEKQQEKLEQVQERANLQEDLLDVYRHGGTTGGYGAASTIRKQISVDTFMRQLREASDYYSAQELFRAVPKPQHPKAVVGLIDLYHNGGPRQRRHAVWMLGHIGLFDEPAVAILEKAANDADPEVRSVAIYALSQSQAPSINEVATRALGDANPYVRIEAAKALCEVGRQAAAVAALTSLLVHDDPKVVDGALGAFVEKEISPDAAAPAVPMFRTLLDNSQWEVRLGALFALFYTISREEITDLLLRAWKDDPHQEVRKQAAILLRNLDREHPLTRGDSSG